MTLPRRPGSVLELVREVESETGNQPSRLGSSIQIGRYHVHIDRIESPVPLERIRLSSGRRSCEIEVHNGRTVRVNQRPASKEESAAGDKLVNLLHLRIPSCENRREQ